MMESGESIDLQISGLGPAELIGEGGNAFVYRSRQEALDREVAVKVLKRSSDEGTQRRFVREQRAMGRMSQHDGIVTVYASGINGAGKPYLVMPLLPGSLQDEIDSRGRLPWAEAVDLIADVATTVQFAHKDGLVHRDLKPANLMRSASGRPLVADFGISRVVDVGVPLQSTEITLTPAFSPPEALAGENADPTTDVYALGATLYALIEGHPPFVDSVTSNNLLALVKRISEDPVPAITADAPGWVDTVIEAAMAKERTERIPSAGELATLLRSDGASVAALIGRPVNQPIELDPTSTVISGGRIPDRDLTPLPPPAPARSLDSEKHGRPWLKLGAVACGIAVVIAGAIVLASGGDEEPSPVAESPASGPASATETTASSESTAPSQTTSTAVPPAPVMDLIPIELDGPFVQIEEPAVLIDGGLVLFPENEDGQVEIEFTPKTDENYVLWARVQIPADGNPVNGNSLYVGEGANLARSDEFVWDFWENQVFPDPGVADWDRVSRRGAEGTVSEHTENPFVVGGRPDESMVLTLGGREAGVILERVYLTNDLTWRPPECAQSVVCSYRKVEVDVT